MEVFVIHFPLDGIGGIHVVFGHFIKHPKPFHPVIGKKQVFVRAPVKPKFYALLKS